MTEVKCLNKDQMLFILHNHEGKTAKDMADHLRVEKHKVTLFCQSNGIEPKTDPKSRKDKTQDYYHIPCMPFNYKFSRRYSK